VKTKRPESSRLRALRFLVAGEGFASELRSPEQRSEASSRTPDLRVMRKFPGFQKSSKHCRVTDLRCLGIGAGWGSLVQRNPRVTPPSNEQEGEQAVKADALPAFLQPPINDMMLLQECVR
jgi:hypothetical protein